MTRQGREHKQVLAAAFLARGAHWEHSRADSYSSLTSPTNGFRPPGPYPRRGDALCNVREAPESETFSIACATQNATRRKIGIKFYIRKIAITWSPLTESNRRPSPHHGDQTVP